MLNWKIVWVSVFAATGCLTNSTRAEEPSTRTASKPLEFKVFDNLHNAGKPDLVSQGLLHSNIVYSRHVWPKIDVKSPEFGKLPEEAAFKRAVIENSKLDGPIVLDFEVIRLSGKPEVVLPHFDLFMTLVKWTHEAAPGHLVGYYGHGLFPEMPGAQYAEQTAKLAAAVDAFFPSMYTFSEDRAVWKTKAAGLVDQAHKIAPGKPVYFYFWPQFHENSKPLELSLTVISGDQWAYELNTARELGADGVVLWSGSKAPVWDVKVPWWLETQAFIKQLKK